MCAPDLANGLHKGAVKKTIWQLVRKRGSALRLNGFKDPYQPEVTTNTFENHALLPLRALTQSIVHDTLFAAEVANCDASLIVQSRFLHTSLIIPVTAFEGDNPSNLYQFNAQC